MSRSHERPQLAAALETMPVFAGLSPEDVDDIARSIRERDARVGKVLIKQGQWGHELLVVLAGEVEIRRDGAVVTTEGPGSIVGETAVLDDSRRNASVVARTEVRIGAIEYTQLHALLDTIPLLDERLRGIAQERSPE